MADASLAPRKLWWVTESDRYFVALEQRAALLAKAACGVAQGELDPSQCERRVGDGAPTKGSVPVRSGSDAVAGSPMAMGTRPRAATPRTANPWAGPALAHRVRELGCFIGLPGDTAEGKDSGAR